MFCCERFIWNAFSANAETPSSVNRNVTPSVSINATCCFVNALRGSVNIRRNCS